MQCALTVIFPFGDTDPAETLAQDHFGMKIEVEDAALIIAQYTEGQGIGAVPFLSPSPTVSVVAHSDFLEPNENLAAAGEFAGSLEAMIAAWPEITMNAFNVLAEGKPLVLEDGDDVVKIVGPNLDQLAKEALAAKEYLRINLQIDSERDSFIATSSYPGGYELWDTVPHPDGGIGLVVVSDDTDDLVIVPVSIECTSFMPSIAA